MNMYRGNVFRQTGLLSPSFYVYIRNPFEKFCSLYRSTRDLTEGMSAKRPHETVVEESTDSDRSNIKSTKLNDGTPSKFAGMTHGKGRLISEYVLNKLTEDDVQLLETINTSCTDLDKIRAAIKLRKLHRLSIRLPEDQDDSAYYIEDGLRKVYPYQYIYQSYAKRRWLGRKLRDVQKQEFRDTSDEQLIMRFKMNRVLVNGDPVDHEYVIKDNDFIVNINHRHELPVLATPIKIIHDDKDTLVIEKPPSLPIHPCGRYRHNCVINILKKEYNYDNVKVVHRLDRLVSGVLIIARNTRRASEMEKLIKNRDVQKEYVCRVVGEFPLGPDKDDGYITVDKGLDTIPGKIGITVILDDGKPSVTRFKRINYNGKTSAVLCKPLSGRMHQIRVHLQYLGHPIVNDGLYNSDAFGPERGKGGRYGKTLRQVSNDVLALHRASFWLISDESDIIDFDLPQDEVISPSSDPGAVRFLSSEEQEETMAALESFFTNESWKDLQEKWKYDPSKMIVDPSCRDCNSKYYDPPLRRLFLYLHALRYSGDGWSFESEMPAWGRDTWKF